jgi:hypothetical protein
MVVLPLLAAISLLGCLVWLVLLPLKMCICCCPLACAAQLLWDVVEYMVKAPLRGLLWAQGDEWQPRQQQQQQGGQQKAGDVEMGRA